MRPFVVSVPCSAEEREALDTLRASTGLATDADVLRLAVWRLAEHYDLRLPLPLFSIGGDVPARRRGRKTRSA